MHLHELPDEHPGDAAETELRWVLDTCPTDFTALAHAMAAALRVGMTEWDIWQIRLDERGWRMPQLATH